jgi:protein-tyrosine phosphatase
MAPGPQPIRGSIHDDPDMRHTTACRLQGVAGFRDLGGFPTRAGATTRHGVLFRSPCPSELTRGDAAMLAELGMALRVDLRASFELADAPPVPLPALPTAHVPIFDAPEAGQYVRRLRETLGDRRDPAAVLQAFLREDGAGFARVFALLGDRTPALVHCTTGRDRTGVVTALALRLAGVDDALIALDYGESRAAGFAADAEPILEVLDALDREWGGAETYLAGHGCPVDALARFQEAFVAS